MQTALKAASIAKRSHCKMKLFTFGFYLHAATLRNEPFRSREFLADVCRVSLLS